MFLFFQRFDIDACQGAIAHAIGHLVEALRNKLEGRGFESLWGLNPSGLTMPLGPTQSLAENQYQVYFPGLYGGLCLGLTT